MMDVEKEYKDLLGNTKSPEATALLVLAEAVCHLAQGIKFLPELLAHEFNLSLKNLLDEKAVRINIESDE